MKMRGKDFENGKYIFELSNRVPNSDLVKKIVQVNPVDGTLRIYISIIFSRRVDVAVLCKGPLGEATFQFYFNVACADGHFASGTRCYACGKGSFNSFALIKWDTADRWGRCMPCDASRSTATEGASSPEDCKCNVGYGYDEVRGAAKMSDR